jgi:hypothetical protein
MRCVGLLAVFILFISMTFLMISGESDSYTPWFSKTCKEGYDIIHFPSGILCMEKHKKRELDALIEQDKIRAAEDDRLEAIRRDAFIKQGGVIRELRSGTAF